MLDDVMRKNTIDQKTRDVWKDSKSINLGRQGLQDLLVTNMLYQGLNPLF